MSRLLVLAFTVLFVLPVHSQVIEHSKGSYNFFQNKGQWPSQVKYMADIAGGKIWLEKDRVLYHWQDFSGLREAHDHPEKHSGDIEFIEGQEDIMGANFVGCNDVTTTTHKYPTTYYHNYFLGNDRSKWAKRVYGYNHVTYEELYDGIDLLFYEKEGHLKYEYQLEPNIDPSVIQIEYEGARKVQVDKNGVLNVKSALGEIIEDKPYAYQIKNGRIVEVECEFKVEDNIVSFELGEYDRDLKLVIDPYMVFATYCGATSDNFGMTATYAYDGQGYNAGMIYGPNYPCPDAPDSWNCTPNVTIEIAGSVTTDVFISKYNSVGDQMVWTNFIGGGDNTQGTETAHSLICDTDNNIYLYGATSSTDFPIEPAATAFQTSHAGGPGGLSVNFNGVQFGAQGPDIYVVKISENGENLLGSTYVGGTGADGINYRPTALPYAAIGVYDSLVTNYGDQFRGEIMLDSLNNILIASSTWSTDFPVLGGFQMTPGGRQDAVVFQLSSDFTSMDWGSYYGGSQNDAGFSVKIDSSFNILMAGGTSSADLPNTTGGFQPAYGGGPSDGFVSKISSDGSSMIQSTFCGTAVYDNTFFVEGDRWDNVFIVGQTLGTMPITTTFGDANGAQFIWKLAPDLTTADYQTTFGSADGNVDISPAAFLVDVCGNVYVSGWGANILGGAAILDGTMPTGGVGAVTTPPNGFDFYLMVMEADGDGLLLGTFLGGGTSDEHVDGGTSRFDKFGICYQGVCGGCGGNSDWPTLAGGQPFPDPPTSTPWSSTNDASNCNALLFKYDTEIVPKAAFSLDTLSGCAPLTITITNNSTEFDSITWDFGPGVTVLTPGTDPEIYIDVPGTYDIILTIYDTICLLQDTAVHTIDVYPPLQLEVPNDTVVCSPITPWTISANTFGTATTITWADNPGMTPPLNSPGTDSSFLANPTGSVTYYCLASNGDTLCDQFDSVVVQFIDGAMDMITDTTICLGDTAALWVTNTVPSVPMTFEWSPTAYCDPDTGPTVNAFPPSSMWFYCTGTTSIGCTVTDSVWVEVDGIDTSLIYATADPDVVPEGGTSTLTVYPPGYQYQWFPITGLSDPDGQTTQAVVDDSTTYQVEIADGECSYKTQVTVRTLEFVCGDIYIYVPNSFSPNGDGKNDVMYVRGENITDLTFQIFDRWGEKMFETTDQSVGWDGTYKGKLVDPDVYVYHLEVICIDEQETFMKGNITVLR